jgi:hypothetical protein
MRSIVVSLTTQIGVHLFPRSNEQRECDPGKTLFLNIVGGNTVRNGQPLEE